VLSDVTARLVVVEEGDLRRIHGRLEDRGDTRPVGARPDPLLEAVPDERVAGEDLLVRAVEAEPSGERAAAARACTPERLFVGECQPRDVELGRERADAENVRRAGDDAAIGREAFDPRNASTGRDARALELPLRRVHALGGPRLEVEHADPRVVPGALRRLVGADRGDLAAGPAELEHVDAVRARRPRLSRRGVDHVEPAPVLRGPEDLRVRFLGARLLILVADCAPARSEPRSAASTSSERESGDQQMSSTEPGRLRARRVPSIHTLMRPA
jgi:hypothetical protein